VGEASPASCPSNLKKIAHEAPTISLMLRMARSQDHPGLRNRSVRTVIERSRAVT